MKIIIPLFFILVTTSSIFSLKSRHRLRSHVKSNITNQSANEIKITNENKEKPKLFDNVVYRKAIPIVSSEKANSDKAEAAKINANSSTIITPEKARFVEKEPVLENPTIVPRVGSGPRYDVSRRVNQNVNQTIDPISAYDLVYNSHQNYYDKDKKTFIVDHHFYDTEKFIVDFSNTIAKGIATDKDLVHVSDLRKLPDIQVPQNKQTYNPIAVGNAFTYGEIKNQKSLLQAESNPYEVIHDQINKYSKLA